MWQAGEASPMERYQREAKYMFRLGSKNCRSVLSLHGVGVVDYYCLCMLLSLLSLHGVVIVDFLYGYCVAVVVVIVFVCY